MAAQLAARRVRRAFRRLLPRSATAASSPGQHQQANATPSASRRRLLREHHQPGADDTDPGEMLPMPFRLAKPCNLSVHTVAAGPQASA